MQIVNKQIIKRPRKNKAFIKTLKLILKNSEYRDIIEQTDDNQGFKILNIEKFNTIVLPEHFAHQNFDSFRRQLNSYGFKSNKDQIRSSEISYINKEFNLECEEVPSKRIYIKQPENNIYTELIDLYNQLQQLQMNQQQMIQKIQIMLKIQERLRDQIKQYICKFKQKHKTIQQQKFLALIIALYANIKDQNFKQYIDDLIADAFNPFLNLICSNPSRIGYQQIFSIINYYFRSENLEAKLNQQSIQDFQDFDEKQSISNKSNISNYFDL